MHDIAPYHGMSDRRMLEKPRGLGARMIELKRQVGRREVLRIAMLGALAILAGCEEKREGILWGSARRHDKSRQKMLAKIRAGYPAMGPKPTHGSE
jgi:hypothetical protein